MSTEAVRQEAADAARRPAIAGKVRTLRSAMPRAASLPMKSASLPNGLLADQVGRHCLDGPHAASAASLPNGLLADTVGLPGPVCSRYSTANSPLCLITMNDSSSQLPEPGELATLRRLIGASRRALFFTGAGISTESGIPDFRSPGGVWTKMQPIYFQDFVASEQTRREAWRRRFDNRDGWVGAQPNRGHHAVASLISSGKASAVITQNVDNLHQSAGVADDRVIELHGNATYATCLDCRVRIELEDIEREFHATGGVAPCKGCGGIIKSATISFGQQMPALPMQRAHEETMLCDLFIVLGSSLSVFPAADFPVRAKRNGAALVIINRDPTEMDALADLVIHSSIGETLGSIADAMPK